MYAQTEWDGTTVLDTAVFRGQNLFALRVKGDSMKDAGILNGDLAVCEPRQYAQNGEIVVALIDQEEAEAPPPQDCSVQGHRHAQTVGTAL